MNIKKWQLNKILLNKKGDENERNLKVALS